VRRQETKQNAYHSLRPLVDDFDEAKFEIIVEAFVGEVGAMTCLYGAHTLGDIHDGGFALQSSDGSVKREVESRMDGRTSSSFGVKRGSTSVFS